MHSNAAFAAGDYRTPLGAANIDRQWVEIKTALDELGPHRSVEQWKLVSIMKYLDSRQSPKSSQQTNFLVGYYFVA